VDHTFVWDATADGAFGDNITFRISVPNQAPHRAGYPIQRAAISSATPPFRVGFGISGKAWKDLDGDGVRDSGEPDCASVPLILLDSTWSFTSSTETSGTGTYSFVVEYRPPYTAIIIPPDGFVLSPVHLGSDTTLDSDFDPDTYRVTVPETTSHVDAGLICPTRPLQQAYINGLAKAAGTGNPVLNVQPTSEPARATGFNIYRSADPALPKSGWPRVGLNIQDADPGTAGIQWTDSAGDPGDWYYQVTDYGSLCDLDGPF
jgi:hypothetical protein